VRKRRFRSLAANPPLGTTQSPKEKIMKTTRLPLTLELANPVLLAGDLSAELRGDFDPKAQLASQTKSTQKSSTLNLVGVLSDIAADVQIDDVIA
jgi:hypothetical protein